MQAAAVTMEDAVGAPGDGALTLMLGPTLNIRAGHQRVQGLDRLHQLLVSTSCAHLHQSAALHCVDREVRHHASGVVPEIAPVAGDCVGPEKPALKVGVCTSLQSALMGLAWDRLAMPMAHWISSLYSQ